MLRACGAVCIKSVAESQGIVMPELVTLCKEAKDREGYHMQNGWVHDYIVTRLQEVGLEVYRKEGILDIEEITISLLHNEPVIVSVEKRVLEQTRFHLITLVGFEEKDGNVTDFYYHESESTDKQKGEYRKCPVETFLEYFRGKAIFIKKN